MSTSQDKIVINKKGALLFLSSTKGRWVLRSLFMKNFYKTIILSGLLLLLYSCQTKTESPENTAVKLDKDTLSISAIKKTLSEKGYKIFDYVDEVTGDTILMQQYYMVFLKKGENRSQSKNKLDSLQQLHLAHLGEMYQLGYADISGPFGDDGDIRGITIYNVPTLEMADSLANADPMVKAGRLKIEVHPWWAAKGFPLR